MAVYVVRRLFAAVFLLLIVTAAVFLIFFVLPRLGGATVDDLASRYVGKSGSTEDIHAIAVKLGLTDPVWVQYGRFLHNLLFGADYSTGPTTVHCPAPCLGYSFINQNPVLPDLLDRLPVTLSLAAGAAVLWLLGGVSIGVLSALRRGSVFDRTAMGVALAGVSLPIFFTGLVSLSVFSYWLGITAPGGSYTPFEENPLLWAYDLLLPWITLAFLYAAVYARLTRAGMLDTMGEDYIRTARAKGLPRAHGRRASTGCARRSPRSSRSSVSTWGCCSAVPSSRRARSHLPGIGKYSVDAIVNNDLPKVLGVVLLGSIFIVLANLVVDLLYAVIDPRVRLG